MKAGRKSQIFFRTSSHCSFSSMDSSSEGFSLIEVMIALIILTFGLLAAGQMIYVAMSSQSFARSQGSAVVVAQAKLETLADLYRQNQAAADLTIGNHGPDVVAVNNPVTGSIMNRYNVNWTVAAVSDPRVGVTLNGRQIRVTATPILTTSGATNTKSGFNKVVNVTGIVSVRPK